MGAMRQAQTAGYGVLPPPEGGTGLDNTFFAQAYGQPTPHAFHRAMPRLPLKL